MTTRLALGFAIGALLIASAAAWADAAAAPAPLSDTKPDSVAPTLTTSKDSADRNKRKACQQDASAKRLRGSERIDAIQICMAEARLDCTKQAVAQKIPVPDRRNFLKNCVGGAP